MAVPFPTKSPTEPSALADWLEVSALATGRSIARGGLISALRVGSLIPNTGRDEARDLRVEDIVGQVFEQIADRQRRAGSSYPFEWDGGVLRRASSWRRNSTYAFLLLLGRGDLPQKRAAGCFPERLFEELCRDASASYLSGDAVRFGAPRNPNDLPARFDLALSALCRTYLGEGAPASDAPHHTGDQGVDVVAWRTIDARSTKLIFFGNCASGDDWADKLRELQPNEFCSTYLSERPLDAPARGFFTPRAFDPMDWKRAKRGGILFDRPRISSLLPKVPAKSRYGSTYQWILDVVKTLKAEAIS